MSARTYHSDDGYRAGMSPEPGGYLIPSDPPPGLTPKAWGVYVYLLSRNPDVAIRVDELRRVFRAGEDSLYGALNELVAAELVDKHNAWDATNGLRRQRFYLRRAAL